MKLPIGLLNAMQFAGEKLHMIADRAATIGTELATNPAKSMPATGFAIFIFEWSKEDILKTLSIAFVTFQIIVILPKVPENLSSIYKGVRRIPGYVAGAYRGLCRAARYITTLF